MRKESFARIRNVVQVSEDADQPSRIAASAARRQLHARGRPPRPLPYAHRSSESLDCAIREEPARKKPGRRRWCSSETKKERPRQGGAAEAEAHGSSQGGAEGALERNIGIRQESFRGKKKAASKPRNPLLGGRPPPLSGAGWQQHEALAFVACI